MFPYWIQLHFFFCFFFARSRNGRVSVQLVLKNRAKRPPPHPEEGDDPRVCGELLGQDFWATEDFGAENEGVAIWKPAGRLLAGTFRCGLLLGMKKIELRLAQFLLDIAHNLTFRKEVPAFGEELQPR